jgi:hypothetical protein
MPLRTTIVLAFILFATALSESETAKQARPVRLKDLETLIDRADRLEVYDLRTLSAAQLVYSSSNPEDLSELKAAIVIQPPREWFRCSCMPSTDIRLFRNNKEIGTVSVYEGIIIEFPGWASHARIQDKERWFKWLDARNVHGPREEAERNEQTLRENEAAEVRWKNAMPESLRPLWPRVVQNMQPGETTDTKLLDSAIARQFPDAPMRIRSLLAWYGSGAGPWSGFPMYEDVAERMLLEYQTAELLDALRGVTLSEAETEGAARLFGGWSFKSSRPVDRGMIPADIKRTLLEHSLKSSDQDKLARARDAFQ